MDTVWRFEHPPNAQLEIVVTWGMVTFVRHLEYANRSRPVREVPDMDKADTSLTCRWTRVLGFRDSIFSIWARTLGQPPASLRDGMERVVRDEVGLRVVRETLGRGVMLVIIRR